MLIPMHYFNRYSLERFLDRMKQEWDIETLDVPSTVLSKATLPAKPKVLVLPGH
jgi:hypothetical protein